MLQADDQLQDATLERSPAPRPAGRWNLIILLALLLTLVYWAARSPAPAAGWMTDFEEAKTKAAETGRMVLVKFTLPGCPACVVMDRTVLRDPKVIETLADFVPVQLDSMRVPHLAQRYGVYAAPSFVVTDELGNALRRAEGVIPTEQFLAFLSSSMASLPPSLSQ